MDALKIITEGQEKKDFPQFNEIGRASCRERV